ncbi:hypothetical protein N7528_003836 [Penicillium herquei]|nr:hypothetical protein N7528_003836 [Penicillium herquei]
MSTLGPDEFNYVGFIAEWSIIPEIGKIKCRTVVINGENEGANDESMNLWTQNLSNCAGHVKFSKSTHMPHWKEREKFINVVGSFLTGRDYCEKESDYQY